MTTAVSINEATLADVDGLLPLVRQFYVHFDYPFAEEAKRRALSELVANPSLGRLVIVSLDGTVVGYAAVALSFSLEYEGKTAFLDELFIVPAARRCGVGTAVIGHVEELCRSLGANALHLETEDDNTRAAELYSRSGFRSYGRHLMTKLLAPVTGPKP
jgi:GNAT superfamily N-acetyltransferase